MKMKMKMPKQPFWYALPGIVLIFLSLFISYPWLTYCGLALALLGLSIHVNIDGGYEAPKRTRKAFDNNEFEEYQLWKRINRK